MLVDVSLCANHQRTKYAPNMSRFGCRRAKKRKRGCVSSSGPCEPRRHSAVESSDTAKYYYFIGIRADGIGVVCAAGERSAYISGASAWSHCLVAVRHCKNILICARQRDPSGCAWLGGRNVCGCCIYLCKQCLAGVQQASRRTRLLTLDRQIMRCAHHMRDSNGSGKTANGGFGGGRVRCTFLTECNRASRCFADEGDVWARWHSSWQES